MAHPPGTGPAAGHIRALMVCGPHMCGPYGASPSVLAKHHANTERLRIMLPLRHDLKETTMARKAGRFGRVSQVGVQ